MYQITRNFPGSERYELVAQIRRAAASIAANIAESRGRVGARDRARFLHIAQGSARELESHL
ncbi:MAG: four helix bundle protein, partial [Gemmatimonadales bacterium]